MNIIKINHVFLVTIIFFIMGCKNQPCNHLPNANNKNLVSHGISFNMLYSKNAEIIISKADIADALDVFFSEITLAKNEEILSEIFITKDSLIIKTLIETEAEKKARLSSENEGKGWLNSRGRAFSLVKRDGKWIIKKGEWMS